MIKPGTIRAWPVEREIATVECVALDKGANLRVDQRAQRFKGVKYEAMPVRLIGMKETDSERGARRRKIRAKAPGFFCIGEVQHGVDEVCCMASPGCTDPAGAVAEWPRAE